MATTYNRNAYAGDAEIWAPFNRITGVASNIDDVIALVNIENVHYVGGNLTIGGTPVSTGEYVFMGTDDVPFKKTAAEVTAGWTAV